MTGNANDTYFFTDITKLFLARFVAFKHLASDNKDQREKARNFLLQTMTQSEQAYNFPLQEQFVRRVSHWGQPEIMVSRCDNSLAAIVYKIQYQDGKSEKSLYEMSFFTREKNGAYRYTHKFNLHELYNQFSSLPSVETRIRQIGDAVLHQEAESVIDFTDKRIAEQLQILKTALTATGGVGIAANQCAQLEKPLKIILSGVDYTNPEHVIKAITRYPTTLFPSLRICINPEIVKEDCELVAFSEGCLSAQGRFRGSVLRPKTVTVRYQDEQSGYHEATLSGSDARVMLHELDHILNGKVYIQRIFDELSLAQCQKLYNLISEILDSQKEEIKANPFLTPIVLFDRAAENKITFDETKVRNIFSTTPENVLNGLKENLHKRILKFAKVNRSD